MFRRFLDPSINEGAASPKYELAGELSLSDVYSGVQQPEAKVEEKVEGVKDPVDEKIEDKKPEIKAEEKVEEKKQEFVAAQEPDWREIVKKQNIKDIYSVLEIDEDALNLSKEVKGDEFVSKLISYRKANGNVTPFIEAATTDFDKVPNDQLILDNIKRQYPPTLAQEKKDKLAKSDFNQRFTYKDDPNLSEEENVELAELMALKKESEAEQIRATRKTEQKQFLDSVKPVDNKAEVARIAKEREDSSRQEMEQFSSLIEANPSFKQLTTEKTLNFGGKDNPFKIAANPVAVKEQAIQASKFFDKFWTEDDKGEPVFDVEKWAKVVTYSEDMAAFEKSIADHYKGLGEGKVVEELENAKEKTTKQETKTKKTLAKTFVEEGQPITLQELYGG